MRSARRPPEMSGLEFYGLQRIEKPTPRLWIATAKVLLVLSAGILGGAAVGYLALIGANLLQFTAK